ncbi:hypothetical protein NXC14_PA00193 (plasmid) [Rhizobium sp. NXC14]|nr:hypothetical protein NXC14_PA00193 [Rhizobium sp. NXC14]
MKRAGTKSEGRNFVLVMLIPLWKPARQHRYNCIKTESEPNLQAERQMDETLPIQAGLRQTCEALERGPAHVASRSAGRLFDQNSPRI